MEYRGKVVETQESNVFGGYDHIKTVLTESVAEVKLRRRWFVWELFE